MCLLIANAAEDTQEISGTFSIDDLSALLDKVTAHMSGEFEICRNSSCSYRIIYKPYVLDETEFHTGYVVSDFLDTQSRGQNALWINEKVVIAFIDRKFYGVAFMLYFYLGHLMARDTAFGISHNISFEKILEASNEFPDECSVKHPTTLMCAIADLQDAGLIKWNADAKTFELLHITPYDPNENV